MIFNNRELKIFATFFILFSFFLYWSGWMENSVLDLSRAIVDENRFEIDSFYNNTGDRSFYNDHYYSNKAPGLAFLSAPIYAVWKFVYYSFSNPSLNGNIEYVSHEINNINIISYIDPGFFIRFSMILVSLIGVIFSVLTIILVYKISRYFTKKETYRILLTISYGLATLAFPYARTFTTNGVGTFFVFLAFYLLFKTKKEKITDFKYFAFAGLSAGFAVVVDYWTLLAVIGLLIYSIISFKQKNIFLIFLLSIIIGISPLLFYNYSIFGNPFEMAFKYQDSSIWVCDTWISTSNNIGFNIEIPNPFIISKLLIFPYRGLFFYYPILLFSFIGIFYMFKKYKLETSIIIFIFLLFFYAISIYYYWWGGYNFGPRFILPVIPFLMLPLLYAFKKINIKIVLFFIFVSIFINFIGLQNWEEVVVSVPGSGMDSIYYEKIDSFSPLANPLFEHYLPLFIQNGPRSLILESFLDTHRNTDIRNIILTKDGRTISQSINIMTTPYGFLCLKTRFLAIYIVLLVSILIWKKGVFAFLKHRMILLFRHKIIFIVLLLIPLLFFFNISNVMFESNWHQEESHPEGNFRWMSQNATIIVYNPSETQTKINFVLWNYFRPRTIEIYVNDKIVIQENISKNGNIISPLLELTKGENIIMFRSKEGCDVISEIENKTDPRCMSFAISNIEILTAKDLENKIFYEKGWYSEEKYKDISWRWMSDYAILKIYKSENITSKISFDVQSFYKQRKSELIINNQTQGFYFISPHDKKNISLYIDLKEGDNTILIHSKDGCDVPNTISNSTDTRCLSFRFENIKVGY